MAQRNTIFNRFGGAGADFIEVWSSSTPSAYVNNLDLSLYDYIAVDIGAGVGEKPLILAKVDNNVGINGLVGVDQMVGYVDANTTNVGITTTYAPGGGGILMYRIYGILGLEAMT